jgi:NTP pyrophosphatase (non-canonical NTP hydrolase)
MMDLTLADCRREVRAFALLMERELRKHDYRPGWKGDDATHLTYRVLEEADELKRAMLSTGGVPVHMIGTRHRDAIASDAADVANMAMMVADVLGCLDIASAEAR